MNFHLLEPPLIHLLFLSYALLGAMFLHKNVKIQFSNRCLQWRIKQHFCKKGGFMHKQKWMSVMIQIIAVLSFLLLATGFSLALNNILSPPNNNRPTKQKDSQTKKKPKLAYIVGLGDSLTRGIGDEKGIGYLGLSANNSEKNSNGPDSITNLAISGQTSSELVEQLKQQQVQQSRSGSRMDYNYHWWKRFKSNIERISKNRYNEQLKENRKRFTKHLKQIFNIHSNT